MFFKIVALILSINLTLNACAGGWDYNEKDFVFLENRDAPFSNISEDIKAADIYNIIIYNYDKENKSRNLQEWKKALDNKFDEKQIEEFVYKRKNLELIKDKEIIDYLNFVNDQEKYVATFYTFYLPEEKKKELDNKEAHISLINQAVKKIDEVNSSWLKLRYFYLAFRLAHFKKQHPLAIYDKYKYLLDNDSKTIVKDWIIGLYAGALIKDNQTAKGLYEFTKLFDTKRVNWHLSYYNFHHLKTNEQWEELLSYAKDDEEKTKFYAIRALNYNSNVLEELDNIYNIDKNSKWFDFVLYRKLLDTQHYFDHYSSFSKVYPYEKYIEYLKTIKKDDMYLVDLSLGYFNTYLKKYNEALKYEKTLFEKYPKNHEVKTFSYILYLQQLKNIDLKIENDVYSKMTTLLKTEQNPDVIERYTLLVLNKLYENQNDIVKSYLSGNYYNHYLDLELFRKYEEFIKSKKQSKMEEYLIQREIKLKHIQKQNNKISFNDGMLDTKTKLLINNLKFKEALDTNSKYLNDKMQFNPFNGFIKGNNRKGKTDLTVKTFLIKMLEIEAKLKKEPNSVMDNYLYANALFNLSYFGNSNIITTVYRSVYSVPNIEKQMMKLNLSEKHYLKALKFAKEKEFKAKIIYMLSKVELNQFDLKTAKEEKYKFMSTNYYINRNWGFGNEKTYINFIKNDYGKYFDMLKDKYSDTKYYDELLQECGNLKFYQKQKAIYK